MDELHRDMPHVGAVRAAAAERDQPAPAREALGHAVAEPRDAVGLGGEEPLAGPQPLLDARDDEVGAGRCRPPAAAARSATPWCSQSRHAPTPSPVRALTSIRGTPGWTASRWCRNR